jgi:hypothetical protein
MAVFTKKTPGALDRARAALAETNLKLSELLGPSRMTSPNL